MSKENAQDTLNRVVRSTDRFRMAESAGKLIRLPTGDGMALVFSDSPESPAQCAVEISQTLKAHPKLLRSHGNSQRSSQSRRGRERQIERCRRRDQYRRARDELR